MGEGGEAMGQRGGEEGGGNLLVLQVLADPRVGEGADRGAVAADDRVVQCCRQQSDMRGWR